MMESALRLAIVLVAIQLAAASAYAGTDISVFLSREYVEASAVQVLQRLALPVTPVWTATASRVSRAAVHVRGTGTVGGVPVATIDFDITMGCGDVAPATGNACDPESIIGIAVTNLAATAAVGPPLTAPQRQALQQALDAGAVDASDDLTCNLDQGFAWVNARSVCPTIEVTPQGAITAALDLLNGCIDGRAKTEVCRPPSLGRVSSRCENGKWVRISGVCVKEPAAPPGGQRP